MMGANFGPSAPWPVQWPCDVRQENPAITGSAVQAATEILWGMTGMRFGTTQVKLRPCARSCMPTSFPGGIWDPWPGVGWGSLMPGGGQWGWGTAAVFAVCGGCGGDCACGAMSEIVLPAVVNSIVAVRLDGVPLSGSAYRVDDNRKLVRLDGSSWPYCQNMNLADTQPGTFSVEALYGEDVPASAAWAVGELACEFLRAYHGEDCQLPSNITNLTKQGVSITLPDLSMVLADKQMLGLRLADLFVNTYNPNHLRQRARAFAVDTQPYRRTS